jgi:outer membrane receptor protein involved in Fe transport
LRNDLTPGGASFDTVNPRAGVVCRPSARLPLRLHASAGTGFVSPEAGQLTALSDQIVGTQRRIVRGNPDLEPEESASFDLGVGYEARRWQGDLTWFRTEVDERIESVLIANTPALTESTFVNARESLAQGYEATLQADIGPLWGAKPRAWTFNATATYYTDREQELPTGTELVRNVARLKINAALRYDSDKFSAGVNNRHVRGRVDRDFSTDRVFTGGKGGAFEYPDFSVWDLDVRWRPWPRHEVALQAENLFDRYYYEKNDYPFAGRAFFARYHYQF